MTSTPVNPPLARWASVLAAIGATVRPILRPGLQVLRRDARTLQLGLDWPGLATLPDSAALQAVLAAVDGCRTVEQVVAHALMCAPDAAEVEVSAALEGLLDCGALVDQATTHRSNLREPAWAALWLLSGPHRDPAELARLRLSCAVEVRGAGIVAAELRRALASSDLRSDGSDVVVVAGDTEPDRDRGDLPMHRSVPHVWVWVRELVGVVGPFVVPGKTSCLRCIDEARADLDAAWPTLVASSVAKPLPVPACDPLLAALVAALAMHDLGLWASGLRPLSWGRMIEVPQGFGLISSEDFAPHPRCGCGWPQWHDTMGA
jgi:hypothetical protein